MLNAPKLDKSIPARAKNQSGKLETDRYAMGQIELLNFLTRSNRFDSKNVATSYRCESLWAGPSWVV